MIENEVELRISQESLALFSSALENVDNDGYFQNLSSKKKEIYKKALAGEIDDIKNQIERFESLKNKSLT